MSGLGANFIPTALACWLALAQVFLGRAERPGLARIALSLLAAAGVLLIPVNGWMLLERVAVFEPSLSVTVVALLFASLVTRAGGPVLLRPCDWNSAWAFGAAGAALLLPATLGLSSVDVYSWGWRQGFVLAVGLLASGMLLQGNRFGVVLLADLLVLFLLPGESKNAWDVLVDPLYGAAAVFVVLRKVVFFLRARSAR